MATTEADIPEPVCGTIKEEEAERKMVDQAANKVTKEKTSTDSKPNEPPKTLESNFDVKDAERSNEGSESTVESEFFFKSPLIAEVSFEAKNLSPDACKVTEKPEKIMKDDTDISPLGNAKLDDQPLEITASEEIILEEIKENAEESNGKYGEKSVTSVPSTVDSAVPTLGTKAENILYDPDQEDIKVEVQTSKETSTEDDGTTNSFTTDTGSPEENLCQTSLQSRESKGSEISNISEVKNLNPKVTTPYDESGRMKTTKDEIPFTLVTDMPAEVENSSDQNEAVNGNSEKNAEEVAGSFLKSKTTDETSSENAVEKEIPYDGIKATGLPILIEFANEEMKEIKNVDNAKNLSCSPLVTPEIEEISSEQVGLGNELHNNAEEASQEKNLDRETMTAVISHEYELQGENESESSFLKEKDNIHIQKGDKTVTTPEYSAENQSKTQEKNITVHTNPTGTEVTEENALIQNDGSQMKHEVHLEKENTEPCFTDVSMRDTSNDESTAKNENEELRKAELSENKKDMESTLVVNATTEKYTESLKVAPEDVEPSISFQNTETTSSLEEKNQTANLQEILCDRIEQVSEVVDRKEETLKNNFTLVPNEETEENTTIEVDGSQTKGEEHLEKENKMACITEALATDISDNKSTLMLEDKMKDADLRKDELIKNQTGSESVMLNQEATMEKPIDSLQLAPEDIKASTSDQDTKTSSHKNQILTENPQEILDDKTEIKICGVVDEKKEILEVEAVPTIELNEDNSVIKEYDAEMKHEEILEKEYEKPSVKEDSIRDAIDDKSTYMQEDKFEDKDLRNAEIFENKKDTENTLLKEETTVTNPIESLQLDPDEILTYASDHGTETNLNASSRDGIAEDITIDAADMKKETVENVATIVTNEDIEEKPTIKMDSSQIKKEEYLEREGQIPLTIEALTGKTSDDESIINHVDNTEHEDLRKAELLESEKNTESLLNKETQMEIPIKSLQVVAEDIIASASSQDTETSSHQERKLNAHENLGQQIEDKTINAADTKEKTPEAQNVTTIFSNEESKEENSLIQMDESNIKNEELLEKEGKMLSLSETLVVETNNEESKIIHEDKGAENTLLKKELQVDKPIEFLKVGFEDNEASVSCQNREATSSLMDQSTTANPNELMGEPTEEKITDAGDTKEKTPEVQNFTTIVSNENAEKNSLIQVDASQEKHEDFFENEKEIPALSETLTVETSNQESTVIQGYKIEDEELQKIDVNEQEESTSLKEEAQLDKPIKSLQAAPGDSNTLASCQDTETTSFLKEQSLTENPQEIEGEQTEDKIVDAAGTIEKNSETHNFATVSNENIEENSLLQMDGSKIKHEELLYKESEMPSLSETLAVNTNNEESKIIHEDNNAGSTLLKEEVQMGQPIESLQVALEENAASVSCQDPTTSSLKERSLTENPQEIVGGQTEDKIIDTADIKEKTPEAQNFPPIFSNYNAENNSLIQMDSSQRKHEELFQKERKIPVLSETLTAETNDKESIIIHEEKIEDENIKKVAEYESDKHIENSFLNEEAQVDTPIESLNIAPEDGGAYASCQETETSSLEEPSPTANSQEIEGNQTEHKIIDATNTKEKSLEVQDFATILKKENSEDISLLQMDGSQMKHEILLEKEREIPSLSETSVVETNNQESIITHEKKIEDGDLKSDMFESERHAECTLSKEEGHTIKSLQEAPEDKKASCQHIETTSSLKEPSLIANTQVGDQIENQVSVGPDTKEGTTEGLATVVSNEKTEEISLEKEREIPSLSEASIVETTNEESTVMHEVKIENKDLEKNYLFQSNKLADSTLLKEDVRVDQHIESLHVALDENEAFVSCQDPETTRSLEEKTLTENTQEILSGQTENKIIDTSETKEKTLEAQNSATSVSNENAEKKKLIQVDASEKKHEEFLENEREILALSEPLTVETNNQEPTVIQEDKIEDEDLQKADVYEQEESTSLKKETQLDKPIESLQAAPGDSKASASCQDTETSFLEEGSLSENPQEIKGDQTEDKTFDAADAKEKITETNNFATVTNENIKENSLLQMDGSKIKHEELLNKESEIPSSSETLEVNTNNEEPKIIHEDTEAGSILSKEEAQANQQIESLQVALEETEAFVSCQDPETTRSLKEPTLTENTQEILSGQTENKIICTSETKEKTLEAHDSTTSVLNENAEKKKLIQVDASEKKHEELFKNEREIPALSEPLTVEINNHESTVIQEDKIEDENQQKVDVYVQEESTSLKKETQLDKPIESLQEAPGDSKASASCQDTETSFLDEGSLTENLQEIKGDQTENKIIDAADVKEKTTETHLQNFATVTDENIEENSLLQMEGSKIKHEELLNKESEIPSSSETLAVNTNNEEPKIIHEDKDAGSILSKEEVQAGQQIESLQAALEENEAYVSCQDPETTRSLEEQTLTENTQEIVGGQTEDKIVDTAETKEKILEARNSTTSVSNENAEKKKLIQVDASEKKYEELFENEREITALSEPLTEETDNQGSTVIQEDKIEDEDLQKIDVNEQEESTSLKEEAQLGNPIESFQVATGNSKTSSSCQDTETTSFLDEQIITENPQEIEGEQTEDKLVDAAGTKEKNSEKHNFATVTNENIEENSLLQMDGSEIKHEEVLNKESEIPSSSETLAVNTNNEDSKIILEDKDAGSTFSKEEVQADQHIESLQVALEENEASVSCQDPETTCSLEEQRLTENRQERVSGQTEDKIIDTAHIKEKTPEAHNSATIVSNENAENSLIQVDASQKKHELHENEREIPALSEPLTVETENQESTVIQEDKIEDEDPKKVDVYEQEESTSLKEETQLDKPIESLQAAPGDSKASASCQDTETSFLEEGSLTENPQEIKVDQKEGKIIAAADAKEKTRETHNFATVTDENTEENSLLQMDGSEIKHEELLNKESEIPSSSETSAVKTNNEESKIIHEDKDEESTLLKEVVQVDQHIESLHVTLDENEGSVSCQDPETTCSLEEVRLTENTQELVSGLVEDKIIDTAHIKEKTPEAHNSATIVSNENAENSLIQVDASQKKHELFENKREIPTLSEPSTVETENQESTVIQEDKIGDEDHKKVYVHEQEESTSLKEKTQLDKHTQSLQAAPGDSKASASCQDTETSFLVEGSLTENPQEIKGDQTEDKIIDAADAKEKTTETHLQNFATTVTDENIEENSLLQMDGSKIKHEELLNKESEISSSSEALAVNTNNEEPKISHEDRPAGSTLSKEEVHVDQHIESLHVALEENEASVSCHDPETTCSLEEKRLTENTEELVSGQTEGKLIDTAHIKEKTLEAHNSTTTVSNENAGKNSLTQVDASQKKHEELIENVIERTTLSENFTAETNNEESIIIHEDKIEDQEVKKVDECESEKQRESTFLHEEAQASKLFESLHVAPEDCKVSRQDTETSSFLEEQSLTENPQEIVGDQIGEKITDAANTEEKTPYTRDFAMIVTNDKTDDDSLLQMDGSQLKHEELLEKEGEVPSSSETLVEEANNEESTIIRNDKFEDEDLKTVDVFEEKHAICTLSMEQSRVDEPIEPLQVAPEDIKASCQHLEKTSSPKEQSLTACPQFANQTDDKIYDAPDTKEKTPEAQGFTVVSNENIEENAQIQVDESQIRHEEVLETKREIPSLSETLTVETDNEETTIIHEDKIEVEDLKDDDIFENEKYAESILVKEEAWVHQVASEDIKASASCQDRETIISLEDQSPTANPQEIVGDQAQAETIDAADTKEKTREVQVRTILDPTTINLGENAEKNSLIQLGALQKKHEEQTESETPTLSDTLMVESDNEKSTIIHEDNIEDKDLKENGYENAEAQVDTSIESLEGVPEDIKASPSCLDTETTSSLEERSLTANPQKIVGDQTEDTIIDADDTKEESLEAQDFATNETDDKTEGNSLLKMDGSQLKHEELLEKEREIPSLSETLTQEANNEESLHKDKFEDEDQKPVDAFENEKFIESTLFKEETKVGKHVESLQITPKDIKASASCQDRDTTSTLVEQSLTENALETVSEQPEDKIIVTADTKDKTPDALKNVTKIISNEDNESAIPCCKSSDLDPTNQLKEEELNDSNVIQEMKVAEGDYIPSLDENMIEKMNRKESEAAEDATNYMHIENLQHEDTTESIMDDMKHLEPTEKDREEAECKVTLNQTTEKTKESTLADEDHPVTERELTVDREEMHIGKTAKDGDEAAKIDKDDEEEEKGKQNISDFSSEAPSMIEARDEEVARLVYEAADEKITSGVAEESNILNDETETGDSKVLKREMTQEDTLDTVKSIEGLEIISHDKDPEILTTTSKVIEGQEVGNLSISETSVLVSQSKKANLDDAQIGSVAEEKFKSNEVDFADRESTYVCESNDQGVKELNSLEITTIGNNSEKNDKEINTDDGTGYKTKNESVEEETQDDINYVLEKQELQDSVSSSKELSFKTSSKMEKITYDGEANEDSVKLGEEETLKDVGNLNYNARTKEDNDTVNSISESSETVDPENMEVVTETVAQLQNCELISKVEDPYTKEDKLEEAAAEIKSDKIVAEEILDPKQTMKVYVSTDKIKEETEDAKNCHIGFCKEEMVLDNYQEDEAKPEDDSRINTEEIFEAIINADENKKVSKVLGEANATDNINEQIVLDEKAVEEPDEIIQANEPKEGSLHQQEKEKSVDQVTTGLDTKEKEHALDYLIEKTSIEDPREEVNSSILVFQEEEDNRTGANGINNIVTKDAELLTMNNKNANTTMMELQEHRESKHGSLLPSEVLQVQDNEKQDKKDETFSSDKVQGKDEISMPHEIETISASKSDVEADRVDNLSRITEDENSRNKIEVELIEHDSKAEGVTSESGTDSVDVTETGGESGQEENASDDCEEMAEPSTSMVSTEIMQEHVTGDRENQDQLTKLYELPLLSHVKDSEVEMAQKQGPVNLQSGSVTADNVQDLKECCFTVSNMGNLQGANSNENVEVKVSSGGKEADIIQQDLVSNTVKQEIPEQQLANTVEAVSEERGMNSEEDKIKDTSCNDSQENSSSVDTDKVAPSNILQGSIGDEAQGAKSQESERQHSSLPILPHTKCSDMEIAQKDILLHFAKKDEDDLKELEAAPLPTTDKPIVLEADHTDNSSSNISMLQHGNSSGSSPTKGEKHEPSKFEKEEEKCGHEETTKPMKTEQSTEIDKHSLSDLLWLSGKETLQDADHFTVKPTIQKEDLQEEKSNEAAREEAKTDEEKDDEEELSEHKSSDMSSEAPVMVEAGDTDVKVAHKKSHNILSGVGSKVKHSIAKVKKAITGKSSHPKSHSPKYGEKI